MKNHYFSIMLLINLLVLDEKYVTLSSTLTGNRKLITTEILDNRQSLFIDSFEVSKMLFSDFLNRKENAGNANSSR